MPKRVSNSDQKPVAKCRRLPGGRRTCSAAAVAQLFMDSDSDSNGDADTSSDDGDMETEADDDEDDDLDGDDADDDLTTAIDSNATDSGDGDSGNQKRCPQKVKTTQNADEWSWTNKIQPISVTFSGQWVEKHASRHRA